MFFAKCGIKHRQRDIRALYSIMHLAYAAAATQIHALSFFA
jgi:hypothetical protein